ncbi:uncharacterized protein LOC105217871 [Zeugodacus cucurbitae]|uniref:uncharacterized protein LOC105217871 n=1 Tax=Zeugodacus cucurbitae TaxID=28588 RepID=UPI00059683D1|nr:uncharacterized protein LOC105217871 [Zeugodacus cucurbitae]
MQMLPGTTFWYWTTGVLLLVGNVPTVSGKVIPNPGGGNVESTTFALGDVLANKLHLFALIAKPEKETDNHKITEKKTSIETFHSVIDVNTKSPEKISNSISDFSGVSSTSSLSDSLDSSSSSGISSTSSLSDSLDSEYEYCVNYFFPQYDFLADELANFDYYNAPL